MVTPTYTVFTRLRQVGLKATLNYNVRCCHKKDEERGKKRIKQKKETTWGSFMILDWRKVFCLLFFSLNKNLKTSGNRSKIRQTKLPKKINNNFCITTNNQKSQSNSYKREKIFNYNLTSANIQKYVRTEQQENNPVH